MLVGLDVDGIIRDFVSRLKEVYKLYYPDHDIKEITAWGLEDFFPIGKDIYQFAFVDHADEIYLTAKPYDDSLDFVEDLARDYEVVCVTSQPHYKTVYNSFKWLDDNGFTEYISSYVFKGEGKEFTKGHVKVDVLIDDYYINLQDAWDRGIFSIGIERAWNKGKWNPMFKDYVDVLTFLKRYKKVKDEKIKIGGNG